MCVRLFRLILSLYPRDFRRHFGPEMLELFEARTEQLSTCGVALYLVRDQLRGLPALTGSLC